VTSGSIYIKPLLRVSIKNPKT